MPCEYLRRQWRVGDELETYNEHTHAWRRARVVELLDGDRGRVRYSPDERDVAALLDAMMEVV